MTRKMKDSGIEWIGEIPEDWGITSLQRLFFIKAGGDAKNEYYNPIQDKKHPYPVYTNSKDEHSVYAYTSNPIFPSKCITVSGRGEVGRAFYRKTPFDAIIRLLVLEPKVKCLPEFYTYFIDSVLVFNTGSSAVGQLSTIQISPYKVAVPPINEQQIIVEKLNKQTQKINLIINKSKQSIEELKKYKQSLITEAITKGLDPNVDMKDSGVEWIGKIPEDCNVVQVKHLFEIGRGRVISQEELKFDTLTGYPVYSSQTKNDGVLGYIETYDFDIPQLTWTTDGANAGTVFLRKGKYNCTNVCGTLKLKFEVQSDISLDYVYYSLYVGAPYYKRKDTNGYKIMNNEMAVIKIPIPSLKVQKEIVTYLDEQTSRIDKLIEDKTKVIEELENYKKSLIYEYITGKKEV